MAAECPRPARPSPYLSSRFTPTAAVNFNSVGPFWNLRRANVTPGAQFLHVAACLARRKRRRPKKGRTSDSLLTSDVDDAGIEDGLATRMSFLEKFGSYILVTMFNFGACSNLGSELPLLSVAATK